MLDLIKYLILVPLAADFFADRSGIIESIKWKLFYMTYTKKTLYRPFRLRPFDCTMCMSFWLALILILVDGSYEGAFFLMPFAAAAVGALISKI